MWLCEYLFFQEKGHITEKLFHLLTPSRILTVALTFLGFSGRLVKPLISLFLWTVLEQKRKTNHALVLQKVFFHFEVTGIELIQSKMYNNILRLDTFVKHTTTSNTPFPHRHLHECVPTERKHSQNLMSFQKMITFFGNYRSAKEVQREIG